MSQHEERARAVKLIHKLMDQTTTRGRTEGEMDQAMEKMNDLLTTFNLTLDEVMLQNLEYVQEGVTALAPKGCPMIYLVGDIARFTDTKRWRTRGPGKYVNGRTPRGYSCMKRVPTGPDTYQFFGIKSDVEMAVFLYNLVVNSLERASEEYRASDAYKNLSVRGAKRSALYSFRQAFTRTIGWRLDALHSEQGRTMTKMQASGNDIVLDKKKVRESKYNEQVGIKLVSGGRSARSGGNSSAGARAGSASANTVNLSRPISNGPSGRLLLTA
jgi:hypothetical protein